MKSLEIHYNCQREKQIKDMYWLFLFDNTYLCIGCSCYRIHTCVHVVLATIDTEYIPVYMLFLLQNTYLCTGCSCYRAEYIPVYWLFLLQNTYLCTCSCQIIHTCVHVVLVTKYIPVYMLFLIANTYLYTGCSCQIIHTCVQVILVT